MIPDDALTTLQTTSLPGGRYGPYFAPWILALEFELQFAGPSSARFDPEEGFLSCQKNDEGIQLLVTVLDNAGEPLDISDASALVIRLEYPDKTVEEFPAHFLHGGAGGQLYYVTIPGDLPQVGNHWIQAKVTMGNSVKYTRLGRFEVLDNVPI